MWFEWFQQLLILKNKKLKINRKSSTVHTPEVVNNRNQYFGRYRNFGHFGIGRNSTDTDTKTDTETHTER
jgi:hypothetical protein